MTDKNYLHISENIPAFIAELEKKSVREKLNTSFFFIANVPLNYYSYLISLIPCPNVVDIKDKAWREFQSTPVKNGTTPAGIKGLEAQLHEQVKLIIEEKRKLYQDNKIKVYEKYRQDIENEIENSWVKFGEISKEIKDLLWDNAWEKGIDNGYDYVYNVYEELIHIFKIGFIEGMKNERK